MKDKPNPFRSISSRTNELDIAANRDGIVVREMVQGQDVSREPVRLQQSPEIRGNHNGRHAGKIPGNVSRVG